MTIHNWGIEYCKSYAEQLRDKTCVTRAVHAAECIEYLLSLVQKEWVGLTNEEIKKLHHVIDWTNAHTYVNFARAIEAKLKEKNT